MMRMQFGKPIASFQSMKHKQADMLLEVELAKSAAYYAAASLDDSDDDAVANAHLAQALASDAYMQTAIHAVQIHGGIGFTWDNDTHLWFKRAKSSEVFLGDVRKMLACPRPPSKPAPPNGTEEKLLGSARFLAARRHSIDSIAYRRRASYLWGRARDLVLKLDRPQGVSLLRDIAEAINGITATTTPRSRQSLTGCSETDGNISGTEPRGEAARRWLDGLLRGETRLASLGDLGPSERLTVLLGHTKDGTLRQRKKSCCCFSESPRDTDPHHRGIALHQPCLRRKVCTRVCHRRCRGLVCKRQADGRAPS
jgi:Acyl-CoA dehydrogenase, C-terminal domain